MGGEDGDGAIVGLQGSFPAGAGVDIIEVCCAISVCLRPFAAEGRSEAIESVSKHLAYPVCQGSYPVAVSSLNFIWPVHPVQAYCTFAV